MYEKNNLFQFATSELSQDALICWVCNNYNFKTENTKLYELANIVLHKFLGDENIKINELRIEKQFYKIDVLLVINNKYAIVVEDKTHTSEHNNQIENYKNLLINHTNKNIKIPNFQEKDIRVVYLKTGFWYPTDKETKADCRIDGDAWFSMLEKARGESEILDDYLTKLQCDKEFKSELKRNYTEGIVNEVLQYPEGQFLLLSDMFKNYYSSINSRIFSNGSSYGRPWSNILITNIYYDNSRDRECYIFCRIDKWAKGYCASIRHYDKEFNKNNSNEIKRKERIFKSLKSDFEKTCQKIDAINEKKGSVKYHLGGNRASYKESEFGYFIIGNNDNEISLSELPTIFSDFLKEFDEIVKDKKYICKKPV